MHYGRAVADEAPENGAQLDCEPCRALGGSRPNCLMCLREASVARALHQVSVPRPSEIMEWALSKEPAICMR